MRNPRVCSLSWICLLLAGLPTLMLMMVGCASKRVHTAQVPVPPSVVQSATRFRKEYVLAPGDQVEVAVRRFPEVSRTVAIRSDGNISLPIIQDVPAAGQTPRQLATKLTELLSSRLVQPEVAVIPTQVRMPVVYVVGDVGNAGAIPLRDAPTVAQAVSMAGGLRRSAADRDIAIIRLREDGFVQAMVITVPQRGQPATYMAMRGTLLEPDDIVFVPENGRSQLSRFLDDIVNKPVGAINQAVGVYVNYRLIELVSK